MDVLTHLFLPLTVLYVLRPEFFDSPSTFLIGLFGLLPDFDKFLGSPGLLHSFITLVPLCLLIMGVEWWRRRHFQMSPLIIALVGSHLVLDFLAGGPVTLLFPIVEQGVGLQFPIRIVFGEGMLGVTWRGQIVAFHTAVTRTGFSELGVSANTYGFIQGMGVASMLTFACIYAGRHRWQCPSERNPDNRDPDANTKSTENRSVTE